jgi:hypothetical protein
MNRHSLNPINVGKRISQMETTQKVKSGVKNGVKKVGSGASTLWQDFRHFINRGKAYLLDTSALLIKPKIKETLWIWLWVSLQEQHLLVL